MTQLENEEHIYVYSLWLSPSAYSYEGWNMCWDDSTFSGEEPTCLSLISCWFY